MDDWCFLPVAVSFDTLVAINNAKPHYTITCRTTATPIAMSMIANNNVSVSSNENVASGWELIFDSATPQYSDWGFKKPWVSFQCIYFYEIENYKKMGGISSQPTLVPTVGSQVP